VAKRAVPGAKGKMTPQPHRTGLEKNINIFSGRGRERNGGGIRSVKRPNLTFQKERRAYKNERPKDYGVCFGMGYRGRGGDRSLVAAVASRGTLGKCPGTRGQPVSLSEKELCKKGDNEKGRKNSGLMRKQRSIRTVKGARDPMKLSKR